VCKKVDFHSKSKSVLFVIVSFDFCVKCTSFLLCEVLRYKFEHCWPFIFENWNLVVWFKLSAMMENLPVLARPLKQLWKLRMTVQIILNKSNSILVSWEVLAKLESENVAIPHFGSTFFLFNNLRLHICLKKIEKTWWHL
jgi:hypothetical protein